LSREIDALKPQLHELAVRPQELQLKADATALRTENAHLLRVLKQVQSELHNIIGGGEQMRRVREQGKDVLTTLMNDMATTTTRTGKHKHPFIDTYHYTYVRART